MRIVSFLPSATETIFMLNAGAMLVGVTHECNYPRGALKKKRVIRASFDPAKMTSAQIDAKIAELLSSGKDIYQVDDPVLKRARPQLLVAQGLCEVCSPFTKEISRAVSVLAKKPQVLILDPHDLAGILRNVQQVADAICKMKKGKSVVSSLEKRIEKVRSLRPKSRPRVLCIEWLDPIFSAGHWVPETVEIAGGINGISAPGEPSRRMKFEEVEGFDPDKIVLMPCGFPVSRTLKEMGALTSTGPWHSLRAVRENNVYVVDANSYFSRPGPRIVTGVEILAKIIQPEAARGIKVPRGSYRRLAPESYCVRETSM